MDWGSKEELCTFPAYSQNCVLVHVMKVVELLDRYVACSYKNFNDWEKECRSYRIKLSSSVVSLWYTAMRFFRSKAVITMTLSI